MIAAIKGRFRVVIVLAAGTLAFGNSSNSMMANTGNCSQEDKLGTKVLTGETPIRVCVARSEKPPQSNESGEKRLVLVLSEFMPPKSGRKSLLVKMPDGREQVLGVFPAEAFSCEATDSHQRFLLALPPNATGPVSGLPICVSVKFVSPGGLARLALEIWSPPPN